MRRRPPCRDSGGDERSKELALRIHERSRAISSLQQELFADVAEFDKAEAWRGDGAVSMATWLTERCGVSSATARLWTQTAAKLESLPHLTEALATGTLPLDSIAPLTQIAHPATEAELTKTAEDLSAKQVRELVAARKPLPSEVAAREFDQRTFHFNDAACSIWASFAKDDYGFVKARLIAAVQSRNKPGVTASALNQSTSGGHSPAGPNTNGPNSFNESAASPEPSGDPFGYVPFDKRLCDVFVDLFRADGAMASGTTGGDNGGAPGGIRPTMVVHADFEWLTGCRNADSGSSSATNFPTAHESHLPSLGASSVHGATGATGATSATSCFGEIAGLGQISRETAQRLACDAKIIFSLEKSDGSILDQKRVRRSPTSLQRIEIARRDKGCRFPGCPHNDFTEVHHIIPWHSGGETNLSNLITLCGRHHRAVHELGWSLDGNPNEMMTFTGPHGHAMKSLPSPTWPGSRPMRR